jgi:hypothetical protein
MMFNRFRAFALTSAILTTLFLLVTFRSSADRLGDITSGFWSHSGAVDLLHDVTKRPPVEKGPPLAASEIAASGPRTILVVASMAATDNSWITNELGDMLGNSSVLQTAIYVVDDLNAPLHTPMNKGNEAMVWLTYMIDFYDTLPEVSIFMHGHSRAWHNNWALGLSSSSIVRYLNLDQVMQNGYVNLRCHWSPGCPAHLFPQAKKLDISKAEELQVEPAWEALFPDMPLPEVLAQPCCSQFALSRERLRSQPKERYIQLRNWLIGTTLETFYTGRLFEYFWQVILNSTPVYCPDPRVCYCEQYGVCFERAVEYEDYFEVMEVWQNTSRVLRDWTVWQHNSTVAETEPEPGTIASQIESEAQLDPSETANWTRGDWLEWKLEELELDLHDRKSAAFENSRDPIKKAASIESAYERPFVLPESELDYPWWL